MLPTMTDSIPAVFPNLCSTISDNSGISFFPIVGILPTHFSLSLKIVIPMYEWPITLQIEAIMQVMSEPFAQHQGRVKKLLPCPAIYREITVTKSPF